ncbi:MAG TPA: GH1 family beta-glucosidase [Streptosporangiales bacterium]
MTALRFPDGFLWGVATSAYQVEGSVRADGRGESIWDRFSHEPGRIDGGDTGDVACDHYARWREDVDLMTELGVNAYRFSIAWPRLFPTGAGPVERRGLDHYDRLLDALLDKGITPIVTLYHWDLPQALQDRGGWRDRATVDRFADYARTCFDAYGDRVDWWVTQNEPWIVGLLGHRLGLHAPGERDLAASVTVMHHLLLAHGRASAALRASDHPGRAGVAQALFPNYPATDSPEDRAAAYASDGYVNRWVLDPLFRGEYPRDMAEHYERIGAPLSAVRDGDLAEIATGCDFIGVNYYTDRVIRAGEGDGPFGWQVLPVPEGTRVTDAGWKVTPEAFTDLLVRLHTDYPGVPLLVTENGGVYGDGPDADGRVRDARRVAFLHDHLTALHRAVSAGVPVRGYCHWSLMDNFEWAMGYAKRFGLVHVDYATQRRTVKDSGRYYRQVATSGVLPPTPCGEP